MNENKIELGDSAKDRLTGLKGTVVAITTWLHACNRITIQPKELKDGKPVDPYTMDEPQVEVIKKGDYFAKNKIVKKSAEEKTGGPAIAPTRAADVG